MDGFARRKEQKKKDILDAALALFMKYGTQKVSIAEIAKEANVSQVTIYNYYGSKDELIKVVYEYYVDQIWDEMKKLFTSDLSYEEKVKQLISLKNVADPTMSDAFYEDLIKDYTTGKSYMEEVYEKEGLPLLMKFINEGKEQGHIDSAVSNEAILVYLQMFQEYMRRDGVAQGLLPIADDLTQLFFYGIAGKGAGKT